jgi:guanylate kinase
MKLVLVGKAAAGKDHLRKRLIERGFKFGVSCTTRPPRVGEQNGKDYFFLTEDQFLGLINTGDMIEYQQFNGWFYGLTREEFENSEVIILNREAVDMLPEEIRLKCMVMFLDIDRDTRLERMKERNDTVDSLERRINADEQQYVGFENFDVRVTNPDF